MTQWIMRSKRKKTGGLLKRLGKKKKYQRGRDYLPMHIGRPKIKKERTRGGSIKIVLLSADSCNLIDKKTKKSQKVRIKNVLETPANRFLARQNILMKGAIIETDKGKARITNRPSQEGSVQAELLD